MRSSTDSKEFPCLVVTHSDGRSIRHPIRDREVTIGRDPTNDICIADPLVSKHHAKIIVSNHSLTVFDLGSVNKTRVNGQFVEQAALRYGDELQFARVKCVLALAREEEPGPLEERGRVREGLSL
jgi:phosphoserine phosphatase RsbU/P